MAAKVAQYVTVIDRSNKVIGNSKQFKDVFKEAKAAYLERKAVIKAERKVREEHELQKALKAVALAEETERSTIRPTRRRQASQRDTNPGQYFDYAPPPQSSGHTTPLDDRPRQMSLGAFNDQVYPQDTATHNLPRRTSHTVPPSPQEWDTYDPASRGLLRSRTDLPLERRQRPTQLVRAQSADDVDLDLAYGEYCPESLVVTSDEQKEKELKGLVAKCKGLLEEADCAGHSAKAIIGHLQKNPEALAAVGLTLAEISSVVSKMAPGCMGVIAKSAPAVMALLVSPQFLIAVGVSVGVTVIAIGGYKIVKRIQAKAAGEDKEMIDEAIDVRELDHIERWRRGIPESAFDDGATIYSGTSVEGEFITPHAARSMGHLPMKSTSARSKSVRTSKDKGDKDKDSKKGEKKKHRRRRSDDDSSSVVSRDSVSTVKRSSTAKEKGTSKTKKPSPLSRMFSSGTSVRE